MSNQEQDITRVSKVQICILCQREIAGDYPVCPHDGGPLIAKRPDRMLGKTIADKYEIEQVLTRGGMGVIYRARHLALGRPVAIKCIVEALTYDPSMWKRFEHEAKSASSLNHPNIITIHDFGVTSDGDLYLVMEYLEGASLNDFIEMNGQLNERTCAKIFIQVCDALVHAHGIGILHRDLKPTNIFISSTSRGPHVKVLDFGLAKLMVPGAKGKEKITRTGECLGTPDYMSPEQARGLPTDQRSDIYATGICMFEALTGSLPSRGDDMLQILSRQINEKVPSFKEAAPDKQISKEMESIVMRCLEKDPQRRFQSMADIGAALSDYLQKAPKDDARVSSNKKVERAANAPAEKSKVNPKPAADQDTVIGAAAPASPVKILPHQQKNEELNSTADLPSKISRVTGKTAKMTLWGFSAATIILIATATTVLMPSKKEPLPVHTVSGVLYYYEHAGDQAFAEVNVEGKTLRVSIYNMDAVKITQPEGLQNGAEWDMSYHQGANGLELDSATFKGRVDPQARDVDEAVRHHYGQLGRKQWEAAYDNIDPASTLRKSSFDEFKKGFRLANHNPDSEAAPSSATKVISISDNKAKVLVNMKYFSRGGSVYYAFLLVKTRGRWLISAVKPMSQAEWERS